MLARRSLKLLRGYLALTLVCVGMLFADLVQRLVIAPWVWLRPASRIRILGVWIRAMAWLTTRPFEIVGGASISSPPKVPCDPGVLILMNHQSLFDIPLVIKALECGYPRIVTRDRYRRWIPLISHMIRLYQYPIVDPSANRADAKKQLQELRSAARESRVPIAIFPEGTRTPSGEIGRFKTTGLGLILRTRPWTVYVLVSDGFWRVAKFKDFIRGLDGIRGRVELLGRFEWPDPEVDPKPFIRMLRTKMAARLAEMRETEAA
jgi:1-acyl-sn-glycerol-3-phosphate acyltransferase